MTDSPPRRGRPRLLPNTSTEEPSEQILQAAAALFVERGFAATSLADVARASGLQRASLYHHFSSKDAILAEIAHRHLTPLLELVRRFDDESHPPALQLYRFLRIDLNHMMCVPYDLGALFHLPEVRDRERFGALWQACDQLEEAWTSWIRAGVASGAFDAPEPESAGLVLESAYLGILSTPRARLRRDPIATADAFAAFVLSALLVDRGALAGLAARAVELDGSDPRPSGHSSNL